MSRSTPILERALADEELLLEEAAVLRAIRSAEPAGRPRDAGACRVRPIDAPRSRAERSIDAAPGAVEPPPRPVRLRLDRRRVVPVGPTGSGLRPADLSTNVDHRIKVRG